MRRVRLTEGQLHRIIRHAVNEAIKGGNGFSSDEDMSDYRDNAWDKFSPDDDKRGPYWDQHLLNKKYSFISKNIQK